MNNKQNKILVCIDASYWMYFTAFGAVSMFQKKHPEEASVWIKDPEEVDQQHLPDLTTCESFRRILKSFVMKRCETIDYHLKGFFQNEIDAVDGIDIVFALDDYTKNSFRKTLYPEYKANRKLGKKSFNMFKIQQHILNVIFKELEVEAKHGYHIIKVEGAEGDDVIATIFKKLGPDYMLNVLIASDRDFIQLENVHQIDLFGKEVKAKLANEEVTAEEYLLGKIILGDGSDNIKQVFENVGEKRALKLIKNRELLKERLKKDAIANGRYELNKKLISFDSIPEDLQKKIAEAANIELYSMSAVNPEGTVDFRDFMML